MPQKNVLVFRTSVQNDREVKKLRPVLNGLLRRPEKWTFDLEDCDHILRVEAVTTTAGKVITGLEQAGFACAELED